MSPDAAGGLRRAARWRASRWRASRWRASRWQASLGAVWTGACGVGFLSLLAACAGHRGPPPSTDLDEAALREDVRILSSEDFEGRRPVGVGEDKTVEFLVNQLKKLGLKPGNGESYLQPVPLLEATPNTPPVVTFTARGGVPQAAAFGQAQVIWSASGAADAVLRQSPLVFVGFGMVAPEYHWDDYAGVDVRGKTVVVLEGDAGVGGEKSTSHGRWQSKVELAARHGAVGILLATNPAVGPVWPAVVNTWSRQVLFAPTVDPHAQPTLQGWLSPAALDALFAQAGVDGMAAKAAAAHPGFNALDLKIAMDAEWHGTVRPVTSNNVVALWPGARRKREYILFASHWDALGRTTSGKLLPGARADAAGVAALLALAQSLQRTEPLADRSMLFAAFTGGAQGNLGSQYYVDHPLAPLDETAAVFNLDGLHIGGPARDVMVIGYGNSELEEYLKADVQLEGRLLKPDPDPLRGSFERSDAYSFADRGVPVLYARAGLDDSARGPIWGQAQLDDFATHRLGQTGDTYTADWDVRGTVEDLQLYYEIGLRTARTRRFPRWYPNSEFKTGRHAAVSAAD